MNDTIKHLARCGAWLGLAAGLTLLGGCAFLFVNRTPNTGNINTNIACEQREDDGYYDKITARVTNNVVTQLNWVSNPRQGRCTFALQNFKQVKTQPQVDLQSINDRRCHIYMWQDANYITISSANCNQSCAVADDLLPILINPQTGACRDKTSK